MTHTASELVVALQTLGRAQRGTAAHLAKELNCSPAGLGVVRLIAAHGAVQLCEVADTMRVDPSVASRQVSALVDGGYVRRTVDDNDRRARTLELTDAGRELAAEAHRRFEEFVGEAFTDWSTDDLTAAITHIRSVAAAIAGIDQEATP